MTSNISPALRPIVISDITLTSLICKYYTYAYAYIIRYLTHLSPQIPRLAPSNILPSLALTINVLRSHATAYSLKHRWLVHLLYKVVDDRLCTSSTGSVLAERVGQVTMDSLAVLFWMSISCQEPRLLKTHVMDHNYGPSTFCKTWSVHQQPTALAINIWYTR